MPVLVLAASALPEATSSADPVASAPTGPAAAQARVARPALGLESSSAQPVPRTPVVGSLGEELRAHPVPSPAAPQAGRVLPAQLLTSGIPAVAQAAYVRGASLADAHDPGCHLSWPVLAALGRVESNHGRFGGAVLGADGRSTPPIIGPALDGTTYAAVPDTDGGRLDGDPQWDHAVGPMQFIPSTWARVATDADGDGVADPQDIDDAAAAAGTYLCAGGGDMRSGSALGAAIFSYNHDASYVQLVGELAVAYAKG
ncbi:membrane-bound lytic murein transglycosylase B [Motilibacter rhizosphaerae]|uniref:Membrane-bound lytic murein transglycosylase B n=1 Tax=Motilibacter rhizosphaerae TaxID=598652 RepID=A0A4Q7NA95_9ACTN|nr:membrane-bound lytic murein transglycosylase B [Motilibacter rhizosphaerae]